MSCQGFVDVAQFWIWLPDNFGVNFFGVIGKFHNSLAENSRSWRRPYYILSAFLPLLKFIRREKQDFPRMNGLVRADCQKISPCRVVKREPCDDFRQNHRCGLRVVCYTSRAGSSVHVCRGVVCTRLLAFTLSDTIDVLKGSEVAMLLFCGRRNIWWHWSDFGLSFRGRRTIWCGGNVTFHGRRNMS